MSDKKFRNFQTKRQTRNESEVVTGFGRLGTMFGSDRGHRADCGQRALRSDSRWSALRALEGIIAEAAAEAAAEGEAGEAESELALQEGDLSVEGGDRLRLLTDRLLRFGELRT